MSMGMPFDTNPFMATSRNSDFTKEGLRFRTLTSFAMPFPKLRTTRAIAHLVGVVF